MTDKVDIFKLLLNKHNFNEYNHKIDKEIFPDALHDLFDALVQAHSLTTRDLKCNDVFQLYKKLNPALTQANLEIVKEIMLQIHNADEINPDIAEEVIEGALTELKATRIANLALNIAHGKSADFGEILKVIEDESMSRDIEYVTTDVVALSNDLKDTYQWSFNLSGLDQAVGKIGPEVFGILAGPVNSGKSLMGISFLFGPNGFAAQGAKCLYIGNEESLKRTMIRGIGCYTGMTREEIEENPSEAQEKFNEIKDNIYLVDDVDMNFVRLQSVMHKLKPDIVILDMLDKISVAGSFQQGHEKLGRIAVSARELAKRHQCVVLGMSQTNAETNGKLTIDQNELVGSRVDKAANADLVLTLGSYNTDEEELVNHRQIYIAKSKLKGNGAKIQCTIKPEISRLVS